MNAAGPRAGARRAGPHAAAPAVRARPRPRCAHRARWPSSTRATRPCARAPCRVQLRAARGLRSGTQPRRRLRQYREQCRFGMRQARGGFAQICPGRGFHAFDGAAERRMIQIQREDFALGQMRFELQRAQDLAQLAADAARLRFDDARDLHGQGRTAGDDMPVAHELCERTCERHRIHARMPPEPAILVGQQRLQVQRRDIVRRYRIAPRAIASGERAQRRAVAREHHRAAAVRVRQRQRETGGRARRHDRDENRESDPRALSQRNARTRKPPAPSAPARERNGKR